MTATIALAVVGLAACGSSDNGSGGSPSGGSGGSGKLSGASFTVGSKEFTESIILGKITEQVLEHNGAKVTDKTGISGSATVRKALTSGQIDMYWDYTGTGWVNYLKHTTKNVPKDLYAAVKKQDLAKNKVAWLKPAPFQDTYRIAVSHDFAEQNNMKTMSDAV
jgi:osmoprotectant transport system substrate-binding protein